MSVSHGSYHYRTDSISLSLSMNNEVSALKLSLNPAQGTTFHCQYPLTYHFLPEGMWSGNDLDTVTEFFNDQVLHPMLLVVIPFLFLHPQVACPPYNTNAMTSFMRLLTLPVQLFKSCVHIMNLHLVPYHSLTALYLSLSLSLSLSL